MLNRSWTIALAPLLLLGAWVPAASAQEEPPNVYLDVSIDARNRLRQVESFLRQQQWPEAVDALHGLVEGFPNKVVPAGKDSPGLYVNLRTYCHARICALSPEALAIYRQRVDGQAAALLRRAEESNDPALFERIADEFFASTGADRAIDRLGDRALVLGRFSEAEHWWSRLLPVELGDPVDELPMTQPRYPDPKVDVARVAAKRVLALLLMGDARRARQETEKLAAKHPDAKGKLAGSVGRYVETLRTLAGDAERFGPPPEDENWRTFAGNSRRNKVAPRPFHVGDVEWNWTIKEELPPGAQPPIRDADDRFPADESLPLHPVILGNTVFLATERSLRSFDLKTGKEERWEDFQPEVPIHRAIESGQRAVTLTVADDRLYVRTGGGIENQRFHQFRGQPIVPTSRLCCYHLPTRRLLWETNAASLGDDGNVVFEGSPVVERDSVYIAITRVDAMSQASAACLDAATGKLRWRALVCESTIETDEAPLSLRNLLTLADGVLYYSTNLGAVAAITAAEGRVQWVATYPRGKRTGPRYFPSLSPDLNPCVYDQGRLFVAAADTPNIQCFDAASGRKLWEAHPPVTHVLGVAKGNLIVTGNRVWGIDVATGKVRWYWPENPVRGYGRGVLAGDFVYWPTKTEIHVLDQRTGRKAQPSVELYNRLRLKAGNLVLGGDHLILAQSNRVLALVPHSRLMKRLQQELTAKPNSAELHLRLADAASAAGEFELAENHFRQAIEHGHDREVFKGAPLRQAARARLAACQMAQAESLAKEQRFEDADKKLAESSARLDVKDRFPLLERRVRLWIEAGKPERAAALMQSVLDDPVLRGELVTTAAGQRTLAGGWSSRELDRLVAAHGRGIYEAIEAKARAASAKADGPDARIAVAERYPQSRIRASLFVDAGREFESTGRFRDARAAFRAVLRSRENEGTLAPQKEIVDAFLGLARVYERQRLWDARDIVLRQLDAAYGETLVPGQSDETVRQRVARELGRRAGDAAYATFEWGAVRKAWEKSAAGRTFLLPASAGDARHILGVEGSTVKLFTPATPRPAWETSAAEPPVWAAVASAGIVLATRHRLLGLEEDGGSSLWDVKLASEPELGGPPEEDPAVDARRFALVGELVIALCRDGRLTAFDADLGRPLWDADAGKDVRPWLAVVGPCAVVAAPGRLLGFDAATGRRSFELSARLLDRDPVLVRAGKNLVVVTGADTLTAIDPADGKVRWEHRAIWPSHQPPNLFSDGEQLVALIDGYQLLRLDLATGKPVWKQAMGARPLPNPETAGVVAGERFVDVYGGWLEGRSMGDGTIVWRRPLPDPEAETALFTKGGAVLALARKGRAAELSIWTPEDGSRRQVLRFDRAGANPVLDVAGPLLAIKGEERCWLLRAEPAAIQDRMTLVPTRSNP